MKRRYRPSYYDDDYYDDDYDEDYYGDYYEEDDYEEDFDCGAEHEATPDAVVIEGPIHAMSRRGEFGREWWGKQWVAAVESFYHDDRLKRGRTYARNGSVQQLEISYGGAFARVQGSRDYPYCTSVYLNPFTADEWKRALAALGEQAIYSAKLLAGEMPANVEDIFKGIGLSLFPRSLEDIYFECSCPDYGNPCKHASAVYYLLAEQIDADPFVLFHLRGRTREQMLAALRGHRSAVTSPATEAVPAPEPQAEVVEAPPLDADLEHFWSGEPVNLIHSVPVMPNKPPLLAQLGDPPGNIGPDVAMLYRKVSEEAREWLGL